MKRYANEKFASMSSSCKYSLMSQIKISIHSLKHSRKSMAIAKLHRPKMVVINRLVYGLQNKNESTLTSKQARRKIFYQRNKQRYLMNWIL